jgi:ring-1,2-phenylacetyl-CoA epoxidase subunit PaaD
MIADTETTAGALTARVRHAVRSVDDPEYPGVSIVDLGLLEQVTVSDLGDVRVGLIPTFSGCPALGVIAADVRAAVAAVDGVATIDVAWLRAPAWSVERVNPAARSALASRFTVAVEVGRGATCCPRCGGPLVELSTFGPSRCRAVHRCQPCSETVEVMRG